MIFDALVANIATILDNLYLKLGSHIHCMGGKCGKRDLQAHSLLTLLESPEENSLNTVKALTAGLKKRGRENLLLFYCTGRRMHLGPGAQKELMALNELSGSANLAGALSLGEIGSSKRGGYLLFHNAAIVLSKWEV